jgi:hypothetical protein
VQIPEDINKAIFKSEDMKLHKASIRKRAGKRGPDKL